MPQVPDLSDENVELTRVGSLCEPDVHEALLDAWKCRNYSKFNKLLQHPDVSADHWYEEERATCLFLTCKEDGGAEFAKALLEAGADPNLRNRFQNKAPIHLACEFGRFKVLEKLISDPRTDINLKDNHGNTPLHSIAKQDIKDNSKQCIVLLLNQEKIEPNETNRKGYTAINLAAQFDRKEIVQTILEHAGDDLDVDEKCWNGKCAREIIQEKYPELVELLPQTVGGEGKTQNVDINQLFQCLYYNDCEGFVDAVKNLPNGDILNKDDGKDTLIQLCVDKGFDKAVKILLDRGVNPNATSSSEMPPVVLACYHGNPFILKLFLQYGKENLNFSAGKERGTALHVTLINSPPDETSPSYERYRKCLDLLLSPAHFPHLELDINAKDYKGNTALHYAAKNEDEHAVLSLLKNGAYIGIKNKFDEPPLANMSSSMLETFLNSCLDTNGEFSREDTYELIFSYRFLVPPTNDSLSKKCSAHVSLMMPEQNNSNTVEASRDHQTSTGNMNGETEPLLYISKSRDLRYLLKHPIITSFLDLKWHRIRIFFYVNLLFYILFVTLLTLYILLSYGNSPMTNSIIDDAITNHTKIPSDNDAIKVKSNSHGFWWALLIFFWILLLLREIFQFFVSPNKYLKSLENYLELFLVITSGAILFCSWVLENAKPHFSAVVILLSWAELVLLIGRHPRLSTNIEMFKTVSVNFLKFLAWYAILIVAFALSFYTLFRDCGGATECGSEEDSETNFFLNPGMSVFKTVVMLTGEFDVGSIPFVSFPGTSHVVFVLFIFLIAIVLFNLLNGLAVSDTQAIRDDAEVVGYVSRVNLMSYIESMFHSSPLPLFRKFRETCCWWPTCNFSFLTITNRIRLFPDTIPDNKICVLPNRQRKILFQSGKKRCEEMEMNTNKCCTSGCGGCSLDPGIVKRAIEILNNRSKSSEKQQVKELHQQIQQQLEKFYVFIEQNNKKLEIYDSKFETINTSLRETKTMVEKVLDSLNNSTSSSSSLDGK